MLVCCFLDWTKTETFFSFSGWYLCRLALIIVKKVIGVRIVEKNAKTKLGMLQDGRLFLSANEKKGKKEGFGVLELFSSLWQLLSPPLVMAPKKFVRAWRCWWDNYTAVIVPVWLKSCAISVCMCVFTSQMSHNIKTTCLVVKPPLVA